MVRFSWVYSWQPHRLLAPIFLFWLGFVISDKIRVYSFLSWFPPFRFWSTLCELSASQSGSQHRLSSDLFQLLMLMLPLPGYVPS